MARAVFLIILFSVTQRVPAYGQFGRTVTTFNQLITVYRSVTLAPDEAEFLIGVTADPGVSEQTVLDALQGIGISVANLTLSRVGQSSFQRFSGLSSTRTLWTFQFNLISAIGQAAEIRKKLDGWQQELPAQLTQVAYWWRPNASQGVVADARTNLLPGMIAEAKRKADALAAETGRTKSGPLEFVSDPAPAFVSIAVPGGSPGDVSPVEGASFRGEGTELKFSLGFRFANE